MALSIKHTFKATLSLIKKQRKILCRQSSSYVVCAKATRCFGFWVYDAVSHFCVEESYRGKAEHSERPPATLPIMHTIRNVYKCKCYKRGMRGWHQMFGGLKENVHTIKNFHIAKNYWKNPKLFLKLLLVKMLETKTINEKTRKY